MLALLTLAVANWALIWPLYVRVRRLERELRRERGWTP